MARKIYTEQLKRMALRPLTEQSYSRKAAIDAVSLCHTTIRFNGPNQDEACSSRVRPNELYHSSLFESRSPSLSCSILHSR